MSGGESIAAVRGRRAGPARRWESAAATAAHHLRQREHEVWQERQALAATLHNARLAGVTEYRLVQVTGLSRQRVHTLIGEGAALSDCP